MSNVPIKPVDNINSHLLCTYCGKLFSNPVINVHCGHTFCQECALSNVEGNNTKCPVDSVICSTSSLVVNRALVSQIDDIKIHCKHGLVWSSEKDDYEVDLSGCSEIITLGNRGKHEEVCEYIRVPCPNNYELCGKIPKKFLQMHLSKCNNKSCCHKDKGCEFMGTEDKVKTHESSCGYRCLQVIPENIVELKAIEKKNRLLEDQVKNLSKCVSILEKEKQNLESKVNKCQNSIEIMEDKYNILLKELEKLNLLNRSSLEAAASKQKLARVNRTPSQSSVTSNYSSSVSSPKSESWTMPFQFKCIGTLRGHADIVWCLRTKGTMLYSCGDDQCIKVWDLEALEKGCKKTIKAHDDQALNRIVKQEVEDISETVRDRATWTKKLFPGHMSSKRVHTLAVGAEYLYSGGGDGSLKAWSYTDGSLFKDIKDAHNNIIAAMVCTEDYLFTSSHTLIKVWDVSTLECVHTIQGLHHWVRSLALSKTQEKLYSGSHNTIEIWETIGHFKLKGKITHAYGSVHSLAVTKSLIIAGTYNNNIQVFDVNTHNYIQKLSGHIGIITAVTASPSGRFLFTASSDKTITVWNLENMLPIHSLSRHEGSVNSLVLYHDLLLSGSEDTEIKVFKYSKMQPGFVPS